LTREPPPFARRWKAGRHEAASSRAGDDWQSRCQHCDLRRFVLITLYLVIRASQRNATATEFFTADRAFSGPQNGRPDRSAVVTFAGPVSS
jgi:hypothetical protein